MGENRFRGRGGCGKIASLEEERGLGDGRDRIGKTIAHIERRPSGQGRGRIIG